MNADISSHSIADKNNYYPSIDGLRGIAILMVLAVHSSQFVGNDHLGSFHFSYLETLVNSGARGVQLFFMVSAFTLFSSSYKRFKVDTFPKTSFYIRRAFRILPFWWLMIFILGLYRNLEFQNIVPSLLFYFGFIRYESSYDINPQGWSLFVEECFYILLPIIFTYISNIARSIYFLGVCLSICYSWVRFAGYLGLTNTNNFIFLFPLTHWYCFAIGIFVFYFNKELPLRRISGWKIHFIDVIALAAMITLINKNLVIASFALMIVFIAALDNRTMIGKIACNRILMRFGGCCYSIYLFHIILLSFISPLIINNLFKFLGIDTALIDLKFLFFFPIVALSALGLGTISFRLIEKPCVDLGKRVIAIINERRRFIAFMK